MISDLRQEAKGGMMYKLYVYTGNNLVLIFDTYYKKNLLKELNHVMSLEKYTRFALKKLRKSVTKRKGEKDGNV